MSQSLPTVLIAEDDPVFRRVMSFTIARSGLTVETVGDGEAAFQRLSAGGVDFLVTDHQMPVCSGLELLLRLIANPQVNFPPTILCTAKGLELDTQDLQTRFGLTAVMHKPFSPRKLTEMILQHTSGLSQHG
jgi:two-component system, chemotaxis family, chemotaxis protein CheY